MGKEKEKDTRGGKYRQKKKREEGETGISEKIIERIKE